MNQIRQTFFKSSLAVILWVLITAWLGWGGWMLSALRQLNVTGYAVWLGLGAALLLLWRRKIGFKKSNLLRLRHRRRRFKRFPAVVFLVFAILSLLGGILYPPNNYDALAYRVPRVLHWLSEGQWHWIHSDFPRLNVRACGSEWLIAPIIAFTQSARWIFLPNILCFLLLPGLIYASFTRLGIKRRVAWWWMWILPTGYGFLLQAGSIANDLAGAVYALAALYFVMRARETKSILDFSLFILACALLTGYKASNIPLLLPLALLALPCWKIFTQKWATTFLVTVLAFFVSFGPTASLNKKYCGDWTGLGLETTTASPLSPITLFISNLSIWMIQNLAPPIFPFAGKWEQFVTQIIPEGSELQTGPFKVGELQVEESGSLGLGIVLLLTISVLATLRYRGGLKSTRVSLKPLDRVAVWSVFVSLAVFAIKAPPFAAAGRLIIPYYAFTVLPFLLFYFDAKLLSRRWWRMVLISTFVIAFALLVLTPSRPLWPAQTILAHIQKSNPSSKLIARARTVYSVYAERFDGFAPLRAVLPTDLKVLGFLSFDDPESSLWWPIGSRKIEHIMLTDTRDDLRRRGIEYILVSSEGFALKINLDEMLKKYNARIFKTVPLTLRSGQGATDWHILQLEPSPGFTSVGSES